MLCVCVLYVSCVCVRVCVCVRARAYCKGLYYAHTHTHTHTEGEEQRKRESGEKVLLCIGCYYEISSLVVIMRDHHYMLRERDSGSKRGETICTPWVGR